jgi:tetratricopeptide (TPR) repeat protein
MDEALPRLEASAAEPAVIALCKRCLSFDPAARPANGNAVAQIVAELRRAAEQRARQAELQRAKAEVIAAEQTRRRRTLQWAGGAVTAILTLGIVGTSIGLYLANAARKEAIAAQKRESNERKVAIDQANLANGVKSFLEFDVLQLADPSTQQEDTKLAYDADVKLRDVILRAAHKIDGKFPDKPLVEAEIRDTLGYTLLGMGRADLAVKQYERAVALYSSLALGAEHPEMLRIKTNLARSYMAVGRNADSLRQSEEIWRANKVIYGIDHPTTLSSLSDVAVHYAALNRPVEALDLSEQALKLQTLKLGSDHPETLRSMNNVAVSYTALGQHEKALAWHERTLALRRKTLGLDHPDTLWSMQAVASSYLGVGRAEDALLLCKETLTLRRQKLGADHPDTLGNMHTLALSYFELGRHAEALALCEETLTLRQEKLGPDHPDTLNSNWSIISSLMALNRLDEALPRIDALLVAAERARAAGARIDPTLIPRVSALRMQMQPPKGDAVSRREAAEMWEMGELNDFQSQYHAASLRAITAAVQAKADVEDAATLAAADADLAMNWLSLAVAAGFEDHAMLEKDADFDFLRDREDFKALLAELKK